MAKLHRTAVLNVVGLSEKHIGKHTPNISSFLKHGAKAHIEPAFPAVTCTAQSDYLTGKKAGSHGIVGNGWYDRNLAEVQFWKQSNHLVKSSKVWEGLREKHEDFTCAKLFWWYNMYSDADWTITPRPMYPADGRKVFDIYTWPFNIRKDITSELGEFPFPGFWGPAAGMDTRQGSADCVSRWIAEAAKWIEKKNSPTLSLVYLPHLDYNLQRLGPDASAIAKDLNEIDDIVGALIEFFDKRDVRVILLSEYGITPVSRPIHVNRLLRDKGWLVVKDELGLELLDAGASKAFAVADHQIAHVYLNDHAIVNDVYTLLEETYGVQFVLNQEKQLECGVRHERAGDLIAVAEEDAWFTYYYWLEDNRAPDFARSVDIHRKPGYDPVELFLDPDIPFVKGKIAWRLLQKKLGFRMLMDVIPLDASLVKGSHGCHPTSPVDWPLLITPDADWLKEDVLKSTDVRSVIERTIE